MKEFLKEKCQKSVKGHKIGKTAKLFQGLSSGRHVGEASALPFYSPGLSTASKVCER